MEGRLSSDKLLEWLDPDAIESALRRKSAPSKSELLEILAKSLSLESLNMDEIVSLLRVQDEEDKKQIFDTANEVKQKVYGDRIVITAPLHIDNYCASDCLYCAYRKGDEEIARKSLSDDEIGQATERLIHQGHKRLVLTCGQPARLNIPKIIDAINKIFHTMVDNGEIHRVNLDIGTLTREECALLLEADPGTVHIYQETYHKPSYKKAHPSGPKSNYEGRLNAPGIVLDSGIEDIGLGLALGLGPGDFDILALSRHVEYLSKNWNTGTRTINLHRVRPAPGCSYNPPYAMKDEEFLLTVAITRLAIPYTGILLTTREPAGFWRQACNAGCSQLLTGSVANPYESWANAPGEKAPFPIGEETHLDEVVRFLLEEARHLPSFCTACPRLGRSGKEFISMVRAGDIKSQCGPNSLASFMEFLLNYATPYTRKLGEKVIGEKLSKLDTHERGAAERLLQKVREGRNDEFI